MSGVHDLGGMHGFGPINAEPAEPAFHHEWERRVFALTLAMNATGKWNQDSVRGARESLEPVQYLSSSYYQIWFEGLKKLLVNTSLTDAREILDGTSRVAAAAGVRRLAAEQARPMLMKGNPQNREARLPARFKLNDAVKTKRMNPSTHTRLPRYCRDKRGTIIAVHGAHVFPDTNAIGQGEQPQWLYTVAFDAAELWGPDTTASSVCVNCWEPYLEEI
ncbi:MAG: nitrile hydratase subunit beta [Burkholderiales bacterium]